MGKAKADVLFTWQFPGTEKRPSGYAWKRKGTWKGRQYLVPRLVKGTWTEYWPHPGLFRQFASLSVAKDEVRERQIENFARFYGDITKPGATLETWCRGIHHMRRAVVLWDCINDRRKYEYLEQLFTRPKGAIVYRRGHHPLERESDNTSYWGVATHDDVAKYPVGEVIPLARKALQYEIQSALTDTETPSYTTPGIVMPELCLMLRPVNLLAYMWLCFARVVSGEIEERPCERFDNCRQFLYIGQGAGLQRGDATTCSDACKQAKWRAKVKGPPVAERPLETTRSTATRSARQRSPVPPLPLPL